MATTAIVSNVTFTLLENAVVSADFRKVLHPIWPYGDTAMLNEVTQQLNNLFSQRHAQFLSKFPWWLQWLAGWLCWPYSVSPEVVAHSMTDMTPDDQQIFRVLWERVDLGWVLAQIFQLPKGGARRSQMQIMALQGQVTGTGDIGFWQKLHVVAVLGALLYLVALPILLLAFPLWSLLTLNGFGLWTWIYDWIRGKRPEVRQHIVVLFGCMFAVAMVSLIIVLPHGKEVWVHAKRVMTLYLTLAAAKLAPILGSVAGWKNLKSLASNLWRLLHEAGSRRTRRWAVLMVRACWCVIGPVLLKPRIDAWAQTMTARIFFLEASVHMQLHTEYLHQSLGKAEL
ncbi:unnamed protein product [Effrenium voratum]|nr:unnamed protein product [Effrenium voratum]